MITQVNRREKVRKRHYRMRRKLTGTAERPRLAVFRSGRHIYAQLIDDVAARTLVAASTVDKELRAKVGSGANVEAAKQVGEAIASRAKAKGVEQVVFDRGGNVYHGRVAALADAAREAGLQF